MPEQVYQPPIHDVNDLKQRLLDMWVALDQRIIDNAVNLHFGRESSNINIFYLFDKMLRYVVIVLLYLILGHIIIKLSRYLDHSTKNMIPTYRNILFNR